MNIMRAKRACRPHGPNSVLHCPEVPWFLLSETVPVGFNSSGDPLEETLIYCSETRLRGSQHCDLCSSSSSSLHNALQSCESQPAKRNPLVISSLISPCSGITVSCVFSSRVKLTIKFSQTIESSYSGPHCGKFQGIPDLQLAQPYLLPGPGIVL